MITIKLSKEDYETLLDELRSLYRYHWNDDCLHADDCGSKVLGTIEANAEKIEGQGHIRLFLKIIKGRIKLVEIVGKIGNDLVVNNAGQQELLIPAIQSDTNKVIIEGKEYVFLRALNQYDKAFLNAKTIS